MIQLEKLRLTDTMSKAIKWHWSEFFLKKISSYSEFREQYPLGSDGDQNLHKIGEFFELSGALVDYGCIGGELYFGRFAVSPYWEPMKPITEGQREEMNEPRVSENFELLYEMEQAWKKKSPPKVGKKKKK